MKSNMTFRRTIEEEIHDSHSHVITWNSRHTLTHNKKKELKNALKHAEKYESGSARREEKKYVIRFYFLCEARSADPHSFHFILDSSHSIPSHSRAHDQASKRYRQVCFQSLLLFPSFSPLRLDISAVFIFFFFKIQLHIGLELLSPRGRSSDQVQSCSRRAMFFFCCWSLREFESFFFSPVCFSFTHEKKNTQICFAFFFRCFALPIIIVRAISGNAIEEFLLGESHIPAC